MGLAKVSFSFVKEMLVYLPSYRAKEGKKFRFSLKGERGINSINTGEFEVIEVMDDTFIDQKNGLKRVLCRVVRL